MDRTNEVVMYIVLRSDLGMPKGKAIAQAGHAVQLAIRAVEQSGQEQNLAWLREWEAGSYTKIALKVGSLEELEGLSNTLTAEGIIHVRVVDEGRTAIEPGTTTAIGIAPMPKAAFTSVIGRLRLY
ncbi:MAG: aminoacyl-tRNA hydrolase [Pirellulales bacterium]|nr:aminoacyl-tRNA hydrolase [Pirellulales bacterium]